MSVSDQGKRDLVRLGRLVESWEQDEGNLDADSVLTMVKLALSAGLTLADVRDVLENEDGGS